MRRRPWNGSPPVDEASARDRVLDAAVACVERHGLTKTGLSDVAAELGVTRQTVYRFHSSTEELLRAAAARAVDTLIGDLVAAVPPGATAADALVECIATTVERLPHERLLAQLLDPAAPPHFTRDITSDMGRELVRVLFSRLGRGLPGRGVRTPAADDLVEIYLRTLQSFVLDPGPERAPEQLRAFLAGWVGPAVQRSTA